MRKNQIYIFLIFIICSSCDLRTAEEYYNIAFDLEEKGEYKKAIEFLDKAIEKKPKYRAALINRGADKAEIGDFKGAIEDYKKIIDFDSDNTMVLMNIGNNYKRLKQNEKSVDFYTRALSTKGAIKSDSTYWEINISSDFDKDKDYHLRKFEIEYERGIVYAKIGKHKLAIRDLKQAVKFNYEKPNSLIWIGESYLYLKDTISAIKYLKESANLGMVDAKEILNKIEENK